VGGLLDGLRVLDLGIWRPVPYATALLAQLGADVIKVEPPAGDPMRAFRQLFDDLNAQKRSIALDLKRDDDRERALELAADAEVVVEGFRPGVADRLGVGDAAVRARNPRIVYCSISGYGATGPLTDRPGHDIDYQAQAGCLLNGAGEVAPALVPIGDLAGGVFAAFAILAAVTSARRTGAGERIDLAMTDVLATWSGPGGVTTLEVPERAERAGPERPGEAKSGQMQIAGVAGYGTYRCTDGYVALGIIAEDHFWQATCDALGLPDLRDREFLDRVRDPAALDAPIAAALAGMTRDDAVKVLASTGAPVAPVLSRDEATMDEHLQHRGAFVDGRVGYPVRFANSAPDVGGTAPALDAHRGEGWRS
jgi:alpha-methylacyl-CoA racemase